MKTIFIHVFLFCFMISVDAQEKKIKFGQISPEYLSMKIYAPEPEADAVIISKVGWVRYDMGANDYPLTEDRHIVLKILTERGVEKHGNVILNYYSYNNRKKLGAVKAQVHLPDGTKIKVDNSQIFEEKINDYYSSKKIAFPQLVTGAIIEYSYTILSDEVFEPVDWNFQDKIPIIYAELVTQIPERFDYVILTQGSPLDQNSMEISTDPAYDMRIQNRTFINRDVPSMIEECCITTMSDYFTRVKFRLNSVQPKYGAREAILNTWEKVAKELYDHPEWGGQFKNSKHGEAVLLAAGISPEDYANQKSALEKLYNYINNNIHWNGYYSFGTSNDINSILKTRSASSGNLNKLLHAGLLTMGISSKPVLMSTRENGKLFEIYPFVDQFNHMALLVTIEGKELWVDVGDKNLPPGFLRPEALNSRALVVDEENPKWINVNSSDSRSVYYVKGALDLNGNLTGDLESRFTGYHALLHRDMADSEKEKYGKDLIAVGNTIIPTANVEKINENDTDMPFQLKAKVVDYPVATVTPEKIYITPVIPHGLTDMPFKLETRTYPIEMNYPEEISMIMDITLPEGYVIESVPAPVRFVTEGNGITITYNASHSPGKLNVNMKYTIKQLFYDPKEYATLKNMYIQRNQKFNEQIVLTKA